MSENVQNEIYKKMTESPATFWLNSGWKLIESTVIFVVATIYGLFVLGRKVAKFVKDLIKSKNPTEI